MSILAATAWPSNADMIADIAALGYLHEDNHVVDLTYGRGKWWTKWRPRSITAITDRSVFHAAQYAHAGVQVIADADYTSLPTIADNTFDASVFDPPYVSMGGRSTTGLPDFADRYGLTHAAATPASLHEYNMRGLAEASRITKPGGFILVKCAPYISSGKRQDGDIWMRRDGQEMGLTIYDVLIHVGTVRPQPPGRRQLHSRNNYSVLIAFKNPTTKKGHQRD